MMLLLQQRFYKEHAMDVDIMFDPQRYGYEVCPHCNGHGSSLRNLAGVEKCIMCGGLGLIKRDIENAA